MNTASTAGATTFSRIPWKLTACDPTAATEAPTRPPMIAWLELGGIDKHQGGEPDLQAARAAGDRGVDDALGDRGRDADRDERAEEVQAPRHDDGDDRL